MKNQTRIACILWAAMTIVCGCKKNEQSVTLATGVKSSLNAGHPIYDLLGYGYDVTGRFANSESARVQVLNIEKLVSLEPASLPPNADVSINYDYNFGSDAASYSEGLSKKYTATVGLKVFGGEITTSFKDSTHISSKNVYGSASMFIQQKHWKLYSTVQNLRNNYLSSNFLSDIASLSPAALVQRYGTHVLTDITLGAKFNVSYKSETGNLDRITSAKVGLKFHGLFKVVGFDGTYETNETETRSNFNQALHYESFGGDASKGLVGDVRLDDSPLTLTIGNWQSGCNATNAVLIKIGQDGLIALDQLISNPIKSAEVKAYIAQYLADRAVTVVNDPSTGSIPIYHLSRYNDGGSAGHYLGYSKTQSGYTYNGVAFRAFTTQKPGTQPVYEFWGEKDGRIYHFYQFGTAQSGFWHITGVKFYAYPSQVPGTVVVWGYSNPWGVDQYFIPLDIQDNYWVNKWPAFNTFPAQ